MNRARAQLLFVFAVQLALCRGLLLGELPFRRDLSRLFIPLKHYVSAALHEGWFPQWWPFDAYGMPLASQPMASLFHPTTVLFAVLPFAAAFATQFLLPLPFALYGTWRLGRALGLRPWAAALAGAVYSLGGYFLSMTEFTFSSLAAAALPYVAWGAVRRRPAVLGVAFALLLLAGDPVLVALASFTAVLLVPWRVKRLVGLGLVFAWALLAAAVQWWPTALLFLESSRADGVVHGATFWNFAPTQLLGLVTWPDPLAPAHLLSSTYVGLPALALAVLGAFTRGRRRVALVVVGALSLGLAVGDLLPVWKLFTLAVPGWSSFRFPAKAIAPFMLVLAVLCGRGAQRVLHRRASWAPLVLGLISLELAWANGFLLETTPVSLAPTGGEGRGEGRPSLAHDLATRGVSLEGATYGYRWAPPSPPPITRENDARQRTTLAPSSAAVHGLPTGNAYLPGYSSAYGELAVREQWTSLGRLAPIFGTKYLITNGTGLEATAVELPNALPRAYLTPGVHPLEPRLAAVWLKSDQFQPGREVIIEGAAQPSPPGDWTTATVQRHHDDVLVQASATSPSMLVLNEALFSGVRAFEGPTELPVLRANHVVRAVRVESGEHTIRFVFETPGLTVGALVSLSAWLGLLAWTFRRKIRSKKALKTSSR